MKEKNIEENEKVRLSDKEIEELAKFIALGEMAARAPKERDPHIPMVKDEFYYKAMEKAMEKYEKLKAQGYFDNKTIDDILDED